MAETFNVGIHKIPLIFGQVIDGVIQPLTGLTNDGDIRFVRIDTNAVVSASGFQEIGNGKYEFWGFDVPPIVFTSAGANYQGFLELQVQLYNGTSWVTQAETIQVYRDSSQNDTYNDYPPSRTFVENRLDRQGDSIYGYITDIPHDDFTALNPSDYQHINKKYAKDHFFDSTSGDARYVTIAGSQTITGTKTFNGATTYFTNGGSSFWYPYMNTSSPTYINGSPSNNTLVWKKWVVDNFQPLAGGSSWSSNTTLVDPNTPEDVSLKVYSTISGAINDIVASGHASDGTDCWTIIVRQNPSINGYVEDVEVPDFINLIGEGQVLIAGQLTRVGEETTITSTLSNLTFSKSNVDHNVERFEATNCVFQSSGDAGVALNKSKLKDCGVFAGSTGVTSLNNNKIFNCFGNYNVSWGSNDRVYNYNYIEGETY
jgi:hypothetical protein